MARKRITPVQPAPVYTMAEFTSASEWYSTTMVNADGSSCVIRRNGATKLWKRRPDRFQIPVAYGLYEHFYLTADDLTTGEYSLTMPDNDVVIKTRKTTRTGAK